MQDVVTTELIEELKAFGTCLITDAIESFGVRLRNEGFAQAAFRCLFKEFPPMVGYAATCKVRSADPPVAGSRYREHADWWTDLCSVPGPRVVVMEDVDDPPGTGAFVGEVHAQLLRGLGCVGVITNGSARELPGIEASGLQVFARHLAISRAYIHVVEYGKPVKVGGLKIRPGDLIHGDRHGIVSVPLELVPRLPAVARAIAKKKQQMIELSRKPGTTHEELRRGLDELLDFLPDSLGDGAKLWKL